MTNYYQCLGLTKSATTTQIKTAYWEFAKNYHPDKHSNSEFFKQRFQEIQRAYETLKDPNSRTAYDSEYARYTSGTTYTSTPNDAAKLKDLTLKVSKLEFSVKEKEHLLTSLVTKAKAKETECERLGRLNADFTNQIGLLSTLIQAENAKNKSVTSLSKAAFSLLLKKHPIVGATLIALPIVLILMQIKPSDAAKSDSINLMQESINADSLANRKQYAELLHRMNDLIVSDAPVDETALKRDGKRIELVDLHTFRAYAKSKLGNDTGAIKDLTYVIKNRNTPSAISYYRRALAKWKLGNGSGYFADINHSLEINPDHNEARASRAGICFALGKYAKAIEDYRLIYKEEASDAANLASIGNCYYKMHQYKAACSVWVKASQLGSDEAKNALRDNCK
jgi:hypothetical protein